MNIKLYPTLSTIVRNVQYICTQCLVHSYSILCTLNTSHSSNKYLSFLSPLHNAVLILSKFQVYSPTLIKLKQSGFKFKDLSFSFPISVFRLSSLCVLLSRVTATAPAPALIVKETLRPLRSLREIERIRVLFLHADYAKSAEFFLFHGSRWRWRGRKLRYDKSAQSGCKWL